MKISELEKRIMKEAKANNGSVKFDFQRSDHYEFILESLGGESHLQQHAPDVYEQLKRQHRSSREDPNPISPADKGNVIYLRGYQRLDNSTISMPDSMPDADSVSAGPNCQIHSCLRVCDPGTHFGVAECHFKIYDEQMEEIIYENYYYDLYPDKNGEFMQDFGLTLPLEQFNLGHTYTFTAKFIAASNAGENDVRLGGYLVTSHLVTANITEQLKQIRLSHPKNLHADQRDENTDAICISYNREANMESPDYTYNVNLVHKEQNLPVHLPIVLEIQLEKGASFECVNQSYFNNLINPTFAVKNINAADGSVTAAGESVFLASWDEFTKKYVRVKTTQTQNDTLEISFGSEQDACWPMDLEYPIPGGLWDISTYACFYAHMVLNLKWKKTYNNEEQEISGGLPIIIEYMPGAQVSYTSTQEHDNILHIHRLFYQWGCLAKDVLVETASGPVEAQKIQIGDSVLTRDGVYRQVRDIITGPSATIYQVCLSCGYSIRLTGDHTLCKADGEPVIAADVKPGDYLQIFHRDHMTLDAGQVVSVEKLPYNDMVYHFAFDEPVFLVAQGIVAGDYAYQQKIRPWTFSPYQPPKPNQKSAFLMSQLSQLRKTPVFRESNATAQAMLYYCMLKYVLHATQLFTEEEAQEIAQFCGFVESNATYGGCTINGSAETPLLTKLHLRHLIIWGSTFRYIKLIPTAMSTWYASDELQTTHTWTAPTAPPNQPQKCFTFRVKEDILIPFHYPVEDKQAPSPDHMPEIVTFHPDFLKRLLEDIAKKAKLPVGEAPSVDALNMGIGTALHLLIDSMLHSGYTGYSFWQNLKIGKRVIDHQHHNLTEQYLPPAWQKNKPVSPAPREAVGIEATGRFVDQPFTMYDVVFPLDTTELADISNYSGYQTFDNSTRFRDALYQVTDFLFYFKTGTHLSVDDPRWLSLRDSLKDILATPYTTADDCLNRWRKAFPYMHFDYNAQAIYNSLVAGEDSNYEKLAQYTLILDKIQKGELLYD